MKKIFKKVISSGIWVQPFLLMAILIFIHINKLDYWLDVRQNWSLIITVSFIPVVYMWLDDLGSPTEKRAFKVKEKSQYPKVNKAMLSDKPKGVIQIRVKDVGDFIQVEIEDNGKGIASKDLTYIFDRCYRTDVSRNSSKGGSGIGLSIVRKILEDHGGKVWATSREGIGTIMYFVLRKYQEVPMK